MLVAYEHIIGIIHIILLLVCNHGRGWAKNNQCGGFFGQWTSLIDGRHMPHYDSHLRLSQLYGDQGINVGWCRCLVDKGHPLIGGSKGPARICVFDCQV